MPIPSPYGPEYDEFGRPVQRQNYSPVGGYTPVTGPVIPPSNEPNYGRINITPVAPMPAEAAMGNMGVPDPRDPAYKPSKMRTVLNAIAGGLAGASGGPKVGYDIGQSLHDARYNSAMQNYKDRLELMQNQVGVEKERRRVGEEEVKAGISRGTAQSLDTKRRSDVENAQERTRISEEEHQRKVADDLRKKRLSEMTEKVKQFAIDNPSNPYQILEKAETPEEYQEAMKVIKDVQSGKYKPEKSLDQIKAEAQARAEGTIQGGGTPQSLAATSAKTSVTVAAQEKAHTTDEAVGGQAKLARAKSLAQLTANEKDTARKAQVALTVFPDVYKDAESASDTLFANRWKNFRTGTLGTEDSAKYAALRVNVELLQSLVTQIHIGNRGVSSILKKFEGLFNVDKMNKTTFLDSLKEVQKWMQKYSALPPLDGGYDLSKLDSQFEGKSGSSGSTPQYKIIRRDQ